MRKHCLVLVFSAFLAACSSDNLNPTRQDPVPETPVKGLHGRLAIPPNKPAFDASVVIRRMPLGDSAADITAIPAPDSVLSDTSGHFQFMDLEPGIYSLTGRLKENQGLLMVYIPVILFDTALDLGTHLLLPAGTLVAELRQNSLPLENAVCFVPFTPFRGVSNPDGICKIQGVPAGLHNIYISENDSIISVTPDVFIKSEETSQIRLSLISPVLPDSQLQDTSGAVLAMQLPPDAATDIRPPAILSWSVLPAPAPEGITFDVYIDTVNPPVSLASRSQSFSFMMTGMLAYGKTWFWQVFAHADSQEIRSPIWSFSTISREAIDTSHYILAEPFPAPSSDSVPFPLTLSWSLVPPSYSAGTLFDIYLDTDTSGLLQSAFSSRQASPFIYLDSLEPGTAYFWRVSADVGGRIIEGPVWSFTTLSSPNSAPLVINPGNRIAIAGEELAFSISASDQENDNLTFVLREPLEGAKFTQNIFTWVPDSSQTGEHLITVTVLDAGSPQMSANVSFIITVNSRPGEGLIGFWNFNDSSQGAADDISGSENHGTISGAVWTEGLDGMALRFDGTNDYIHVSNPAGLNIGSQSWTVSLWMKSDSTGGRNFQFMVSRHECGWNPNCTGAAKDAAAYILGLDDKYAFFSVTSNNASTARLTDSLTGIVDGNWHHVAGVLDRGSDSLRLFIDGRQACAASSAGINEVDDAGSPLSISRKFVQGWGVPVYYYNGWLDEIRMYNRALSAEEILVLWKRYGG